MLISRIRHDHLVKNAMFIALSNVSMGALGFAFWILAARLFNPAQVGVATTLVTASILISYLSQLGFNSTFVQFLPFSERRDDEISTGLTSVFVTAAALGTVYVVIAPLLVHPLAFLRQDPAEAVATVAFITCGSVNLVTDAVFIAYRSAVYNFAIDGVIQSVVRIAVPVLVVGLGGFGLFSAIGWASTVAVAASIAMMRVRFGYRPRPLLSPAVLRSVFRFGVANYASVLLAMIPIVVLPTVIVRADGAAAGGYFYLAMQVCNLLYGGSLAVCQSLFAEGSNKTAPLRALGSRSARLQAVLLLPPALVLAVTARWALSIFGPGYAHHATAALVVMAASTPAVILNNWTSTMLRLAQQLGVLVWSNVVLAAVTCGLAVVWAARGIAWVGVAWLIGNLLSGVVGGVPLVLTVHRRAAVAA